MVPGQTVDPEIYDQPLFKIDFVERKTFYAKPLFDNESTEVVMKIDDGIILFFFKLTDQLKFRFRASRRNVCQ